MRKAPKLCAFLFAAAATAAVAPAGAVVVERIVAIVGEHPILLSELRARARPFLAQIQQKVPAGAHQTAAESQMLKDLIDKMVDEELEAQAAEKAHSTVLETEVESAIGNIAASQGLTVADLFKEASARSGLNELEYRDEIRRQLIEGKMLQLRVKGRIRVTEEDLKAMYDRTLKEERKRRAYRAAWIVLRILPGSSQAAIEQRYATAQRLSEEARAGQSFAALAMQSSDDTATRDGGGDLGIRAPQASQDAVTGKYQPLAQELEDKLMVLEPGQVSEPTKYGDAVVILQLVSRQPSRYAAGYEAAKPEIFGLLQAEILGRAKRKWLDELKARSRVTVRL